MHWPYTESAALHLAFRANVAFSGRAAMAGSSAERPKSDFIDDSSASGQPSADVSDRAGSQERHRRQSKRRQSRLESTNDEPPAEQLGCNETHHKVVVILREVRDHTAFTLFFILAILYSGVIVSNCPRLCVGATRFALLYVAGAGGCGIV